VSVDGFGGKPGTKRPGQTRSLRAARGKIPGGKWVYHGVEGWGKRLAGEPHIKKTQVPRAVMMIFKKGRKILPRVKSSKNSNWC